MTDVMIIGGGPAGLTAAIYALRSGLTVKVFEKLVFGGQIAATPEVENYPAIQHITGFEFAMNLHQQAEKLGAVIQMEAVEKLEAEGPIKKIYTASGVHEGKAIIIANGVQRRKLGCPGEEEFSGRGVSYCATCDGAFFKGKEVAIVGGGNTALEDALFLANNSSKVYLIHRRESFRGDDVLVEAVRGKENIEVLLQHGVTKITGDKKVHAITVQDLASKEEKQLDVSGIFIAIGLEPDNKAFADAVDLDEAGYIIADETCVTKTPGVYVAGDSRRKILRQLVTAAADGAMAAFQAANYINMKK